MRTTTISKEVAEGSQDVRYTEVMSLLIGRKKHKLRVRIRSDFYKEQCFAYVERWSGAAWSKVHSLLDLKTRRGLHGLNKGAAAFKTDRDELVRVAERVLA
jgi:hypothetical protein